MNWRNTLPASITRHLRTVAFGVALLLSQTAGAELITINRGFDVEASTSSYSTIEGPVQTGDDHRGESDFFVGPTFPTSQTVSTALADRGLSSTATLNWSNTSSSSVLDLTWQHQRSPTPAAEPGGVVANGSSTSLSFVTFTLEVDAFYDLSGSLTVSQPTDSSPAFGMALLVELYSYDLTTFEREDVFRSQQTDELQTGENRTYTLLGGGRTQNTVTGTTTGLLAAGSYVLGLYTDTDFLSETAADPGATASGVFNFSLTSAEATVPAPPAAVLVALAALLTIRLQRNRLA